MASWRGLGWPVSHVSGEVEESEMARQGGLMAGMASFLGTVASKPFPQLLHSSTVLSRSVIENPQLPSRPWVGVFRPPSFFQYTLSRDPVSAESGFLSHIPSRTGSELGDDVFHVWD